MSQFERFVCIDRLLREKGALRCAEVAHRYEVTERQVKRDIEYLRDRLDAPIIYDRRDHVYRYDRPFDSLKFADEKLLIFSVLLRNLALNEHYVPVVSRELLAEVERRVSANYRLVSEHIRYVLPVSEPIDMEDFTSICQAMLLQRRIDIEYENAKGEQTARTVEPERLVNYSGRWYLVGFDLLRNDLRTFHLCRMRQVSLSHVRSMYNGDPAHRVAVDSYVAAGFGIFNGTDTKVATIRIHGPASAVVAHQSWHPCQRVIQGTTDGVPYTDLTLPVSDWRELLGRVLSFGASAEAVAPEEFRELWHQEIRKMAERAGEEKTSAKGPPMSRWGE